MIVGSYVKSVYAERTITVNWGLEFPADTITTRSWTAPGLTNLGEGFSGQNCTIRIGGGVAGLPHVLTNRVTTTSGEKDEATITVQIL